MTAAVVLAFQFFNMHWQVAYYTCLGIGVYGICRSIVELHGGRLWATPRAGGGAEVAILRDGDDGAGSELLEAVDVRAEVQLRRHQAMPDVVPGTGTTCGARCSSQASAI